jgi:hypothetical protein
VKRAVGITGIAAFVVVALGMTGLWVMLSAPTADPSTLPSELVDVNSDAGQQLFSHALAKTDYEQLAPEFVSQSRRAFCGVATSVIVINAMLHPEPRLTQRTLFTPNAAAVRGEIAASFSGLTLEQLAQMIEAHGLQAEATYAAQSTLEAFREVARTTLAEPGVFLAVNYDRKGLKQEGAGHISPVAAYSSEMDAVLVLDVAAHKYPHTWVPLDKLWSSMNTLDGMSGQSRGYLLVSTGAVQQAVPAGR